MKTINRFHSPIKTYVLFMVLSLFPPLILSCSPVYYGQVEPQYGNVTFQMFYDDLSPYGQWVNYSSYGYVWIPDAGNDFFPYLTNGHWVLTRYGWTWVSGYSWGWAPFHYGRWDFDDQYGWFWIPDNIWGPCWVTWRRADGYYGWAPMRPGVSIDISFRGEFRDADRWCFVPDRDFGRADLTSYNVNRRDNGRLISTSRVITNTYVDQRRNITYVSGPRRDEVQRYTGSRINTMTIMDRERPGEQMNGSQLQIYRPQIKPVTAGNEQPAPHKITDLNEIRRNRGNNPAIERNPVQPGEINKQEIHEEPGKQINKEPAAVEPRRNATPPSRPNKTGRANRRNNRDNKKPD